MIPPRTFNLNEPKWTLYFALKAGLTRLDALNMTYGKLRDFIMCYFIAECGYTEIRTVSGADLASLPE